MVITAQQVKELREKTGAGMMDCKKALTEADGEFEKAIEILRKKGASVAAKRADRTANEGIILTKISEDNTKAIILEVNCETDFVAKSDDFVNFSKFVLNTIENHNPQNIEELLKLSYQGKLVVDELTNITGKIGEKIEISRFNIENIKDGLIVDYVHHGSKLGVLVIFENVSLNVKTTFNNLGKDIAMQIAAMKPLYVYREEEPNNVIEKEKEIYKELAKKEGKPEHILDKIAEGRLNKYYQENCLFEQASVKDNSKTVGDLIKEFNQKNASNCKIKLFRRFHLSDENK